MLFRRFANILKFAVHPSAWEHLNHLRFESLNPSTAGTRCSEALAKLMQSEFEDARATSCPSGMFVVVPVG
jgi:hypothetical protein